MYRCIDVQMYRCIWYILRLWVCVCVYIKVQTCLIANIHMRNIHIYTRIFWEKSVGWLYDPWNLICYLRWRKNLFDKAQCAGDCLWNNHAKKVKGLGLTWSLAKPHAVSNQTWQWEIQIFHSKTNYQMVRLQGFSIAKVCKLKRVPHRPYRLYGVCLELRFHFGGLKSYMC